MQAGQLRHRITLERPVTIQTNAGEPIVNWLLVMGVWAAVAPLTGKEYYLRDQTRDEVDTAILVRWSPHIADMDPTWRVVFNGVRYDIQSVINTDVGDRQLRIFCRRASQQGNQ